MGPPPSLSLGGGGNAGTITKEHIAPVANTPIGVRVATQCYSVQETPCLGADTLDLPVIDSQRPTILPIQQADQDRPITPIHVDQLRNYLEGYPSELHNHLISGFSSGFSLGCEGQPPIFNPHNLPSPLAQPDIVTDKIAKELNSGRIAGTFHVPPFDNFVSSPLGLVPKKQPGQFRLIHHLSYPKGYSVNDGIPRERATVQYSSIDDAVTILRSLGHGIFMAKTYIKNLHFDFFLFRQLINIGWVSLGRVNSIFTNACRWAVRLPVICLNLSVQIWNGLKRLSWIYHMSFTF